MRKAISDYSVPLRIVGLAALALLAACSPTATQTRTLVPLTTPTVVAAMGGEEWHYVVLGDSQMWGIGDYYAKYIEADLRVKVELDDYWKGLTTATDLLDDLRTFDVVRNAVKRANVVTLHHQSCGKYRLARGDLTRERQVRLLRPSPRELQSGPRRDLWRNFDPPQGTAHDYSRDGQLCQLLPLQRMEEARHVRRI